MAAASCRLEKEIANKAEAATHVLFAKVSATQEYFYGWQTLEENCPICLITEK